MSGIDLPSLVVGLGLGAGGLGLFQWWQRQQKRPVATSSTQTDSHLLQEQLEQTRLAYQMAVAMHQFKTGFLARVSHELRSPLNSLIGTQQLILTGLCDNPEEEREFIEKAHESALNLMKMIDQILDVSRTEYGTDKLEIQPLALAEVLEDVDHLVHMQARNRNIRLRMVLPPPDVYVLADPIRLKQALLHLLDAPLLVMTEGEIKVSVHIPPLPGYAHIWIDDQRSASAWEEPLNLLQSVPDPLPSAEFYLSPGMKLLLCQTLIELMHGHLEVLAVPTAVQDLLQVPQIGMGAPLPPPDWTRVQCSIPLVTPEAE